VEFRVAWIQTPLNLQHIKVVLEVALVNIHLRPLRYSHYNSPKMKKAPSGISPLIPVSKKNTKPLYRQVYEGFRQAIVSGNLRAAQRVPSTRVLAEELGISRVPVLSAYAQLLSEGYFESRTGSGTIVSTSLPSRGAVPQPKSNLPSAPEPGRRKVSKWCTALPSAEGFYGRRGIKPFSLSQIAFEHFPLGIWNRLVTRHARSARAGSFDYGDPMGLKDLREAIATYLRTARGVRCEAQQIVIVSGSQQGLEIATRVLLDAGDRVCMEEPGYNFARSIFASSGCQVVPVRVDGEGLEVSGLERCRNARAVLVTPSHQYPLGVTMSATRRLQLLDWAQRNGSWIIEDDYDSEYRYEGLPITSLQGLDRNGRVVYIGTFSKVLFPSLRLGYVVLPTDLVERFLAVRFAMDICPGTFHQMVLADFIREGHFSRHIRRMRSIYGERRNALTQGILEELGTAAELPGGLAGLHLSVILQGISDRQIAARASRQNLSLTPLSPFYAGKASRQGFVLGFGSTPVEEMPAAVHKLRMVLASKS
jgi:GntR family transcriptional regulator/MocR family aminotransferase